jgi:hypothetical protein
MLAEGTSGAMNCAAVGLVVAPAAGPTRRAERGALSSPGRQS